MEKYKLRMKELTKKEKREEGIKEFQGFLSGAIRRNATFSERKDKQEECIKNIVGTAIYNFNHKSSLRICYEGEWLNNGYSDFQTLKF